MRVCVCVCVHRIHVLPIRISDTRTTRMPGKNFSLSPRSISFSRSISRVVSPFSFLFHLLYLLVDLHLLPVVDSDAEPEAYLGTGNQYREKLGLPCRMHLPISQAGNHGAVKER